MVLVIDEKLGCQITEMELNTTHRAVRSRCGNRTRVMLASGQEHFTYVGTVD